jgi:hypothetical protein
VLLLPLFLAPCASCCLLLLLLLLNTIASTLSAEGALPP